MVGSWNREPSPDQSRAKYSQAERHTPSIRFNGSAERFTFDGKPRVPNFLNGFDGQMNEARAHLAPVNTSTHTQYDFQGAGTGTANISMASDMARSLTAVVGMRSTRPKSATSRSLVANDTRYGHLDEPHRDHVGPGAYAIERAAPGLGVLPLDSHTSSATPHRDPYRLSPPFLGPERPSSANWVRPGGCAPDAVYISPEYVPGPDKAVPWELNPDRRPEATEWRHADTRLLAGMCGSAGHAGDHGSGTAPRACDGFSSDLHTDTAGRPLDVSLRAEMRNPHGVGFTSREPRLMALPPERHNDVRPARHATGHAEETAHLGPGAYTPMQSVGGARRRTYRMYVDPAVAPQPSPCFMGGMQADAAAIVHAYGAKRWPRYPGTSDGLLAGKRPAPAAAGKGGTAAPAGPPGSLTSRSNGSSGSMGGGRMGPSAAFAGPFRSQKAGAFNWRTDSSLVRH